MLVTKENIKYFQDAKSASFSQVGPNSNADYTQNGKIKLNFEDTIRGQVVDSNIILDNVDSFSNDHDKECRLSQMTFDNYVYSSLYSDSTARTAFDMLKVGDDIRLDWQANRSTGLDMLQLRVNRGKKVLNFHLEQRINNSGYTKMVNWSKLPEAVFG